MPMTRPARSVIFSPLSGGGYVALQRSTHLQPTLPP
jgi:hypothetical protein